MWVGVKVYRCWNGGGTVKLVVLNSDYKPAADELIKEVENVIDPAPKGKGYGPRSYRPYCNNRKS